MVRQHSARRHGDGNCPDGLSAGGGVHVLEIPLSGKKIFDVPPLCARHAPELSDAHRAERLAACVEPDGRQRSVWGDFGLHGELGAGIFHLIKGYYDTVDPSISEAAQMDGATQLQIFYRIFLPIGKPIIIYTLLMGFLLPWSDISIVDAVLPGFTVGEGMQWIMDSTLQDNLPTFCAGSVVISVPIVTLVLLLQKYYFTGETIRMTGKPPHSVE